MRIGADPSVLLGGPPGDYYARKLDMLWEQLSDNVKADIVSFATVHATVFPTEKKETGETGSDDKQATTS